MIGRQSSRFVARSYTRPLRFAVLLQSPVTAQAFRQAVRVLGSLWGGARSLIVTGSAATIIDIEWVEALKALDPDVVLVSRSFRGALFRRMLLEKLDDLRLAPFWVASLAEPLRLGDGWTVQSISGLGDDGADSDYLTRVTSADQVRLPSPVEIAVLGVRSSARRSSEFAKLTRGERRALAYPHSLLKGSPIARAARDVPGLRTQVSLLTPFLYHERDDKTAAMWLWNLRALRGGLLHGGETDLLNFLRFLAAAPTRQRMGHRVLCLDPWPETASSFVGSAPDLRVRPEDPAKFRWLPILRPSTTGFDEELDELTAVDGALQIARRAPRTRGVGGNDELVQGDGAYAIELDLEPSGGDGLRVSLPPSPRLANGLLSTSYAGRPRQLSRLGVQSRVRTRGDSTLAVLPVRWPRSIALSIPTMATVLLAAAGPGYTFERSDKGHFGGWMVGRVGGLAGLRDLLMESRSRAILEAFRSHHLSGRKPTGSYRRFMTFDEMRDYLRTERRAGRVAPQPRGYPDEEWLGDWLQKQVAIGVLRLGLWARCNECRDGSFLSLSSFTDTFVCPRCGAVAETPAVPRFGYQLAEVAHLFFHNDCDITALAVAALARRSQGGFSFDLDHNVSGPRRLRNELDFFAVIDGGIYVGESKKTGAFDADDFSVLRRVAQALKARAVVLATGTECNGGCSDHCVRDMMTWDASSDTALPPAARRRAEELRASLAPSCKVIVVCRGDLSGPFKSHRSALGSA